MGQIPEEREEWKKRPLHDLDVIYMWVDGVYVKAGLEKEKAALLVGPAAVSIIQWWVQSVTCPPSSAVLLIVPRGQRMCKPWPSWFSVSPLARIVQNRPLGIPGYRLALQRALGAILRPW